MAENEIEISELEFTQELVGDNLIPVESSTDTKATSLQILKDWLSSFFVGKTGNDIKNGDLTVDGNTILYSNAVGTSGKTGATYLKNAYVDYMGEIPAGVISSLYFSDKNNNTYAVVETYRGIGGENGLRLNVRDRNGQWMSQDVNLYSKNGLSGIVASTPIQAELEDGHLTTRFWVNRSTFCRFQGVADIGSGYVTPHVGFIAVRAGGNNRTSWCDFNGNRVFDSGWGASYGSPDNEFIPVGKGVTITFAGLGYIKFFYNTTV